MRRWHARPRKNSDGPGVGLVVEYHISGYGSYGIQIPRDLDGFTHITAEGWMGARMDWGTDGEPDLAWARDMAQTARAETARAEAALAEWRAS